MIDRRDFAHALGLGLLGTPLLAGAQATSRLPVVGVLTTNQTVRGRSFNFIVQGLREQGFEEGKHFSFEIRSALGQPAAFPDLAAQLVRGKVDVLTAGGPAAIRAARDATRTIPIVAYDEETDSVQAGWASSLARSGGNLTGLFVDAPALAGKWLQLLREAAPKMRRIGLLWDATTSSAQRLAAQAAAQGFGIEAVVFALDKRLPVISPFRLFAELGGLMSYSVSRADFQPRAGVMIARILKGEKPADMAIELPTRFELVINLPTAKAMGITIPQALRLSADELIE